MSIPDDVIEAMARAIRPEWFYMLPDGSCILDNYPKQHEHYQAQAREYARAALAAAEAMGWKLVLSNPTKKDQWDEGWAAFESWYAEAVKTRPELDDLDLTDRIEEWYKSQGWIKS